MSKPVYVNYCAHFTEAWYQLSKVEQDNLMAKSKEIDKSVGAKELIYCDSRWADEGTLGWGVTEFPDMDAYLKMTEEYEKMSWFRYLSVKTILGTKIVE
jgi:hypothetical protein